MKYYIIAGEASGDLHGANLMKALIREDQGANIRYWGGDLMSKIGGTLIKHYKDLAFMGFVEVLFNLKTIFKNISFCKNDIVKFNPDVVIFMGDRPKRTGGGGGTEGRLRGPSESRRRTRPGRLRARTSSLSQ